MKRIAIIGVVVLSILANPCNAQKKKRKDKKATKQPCYEESITQYPNSFKIYAVGQSANEKSSENKALYKAKQQGVSILTNEFKKHFVSNTTNALTLPDTSLSKLVMLLLFNDKQFLPTVNCKGVNVLDGVYHTHIVYIINYAFIYDRLVKVSNHHNLPESISKQTINDVSNFYK